MPGVKYRQITPYDGWPTKSYLEELEKEYENLDINTSKISADEESLPRKPKSKKKRTRTKSSGTVSY